MSCGLSRWAIGLGVRSDAGSRLARGQEWRMLLPPRVRLQSPPGGQAVQLYSLRVVSADSADACFAFASPIFGALWMPLERARRHECDEPENSFPQPPIN